MCGSKNSFGNVGIRRTFILRGCGRCDFREDIPLPAIDKKIVYLDQFFFSSAFKENDDRFLEIAAKIERLKTYQLLLAPYSSIHEDETHQWSGYGGKTPDSLMEFIKRTSSGHEFEATYNLEEAQLISAFKKYLEGGSSVFKLDIKDALIDEVNHWDDYFYIDVGRYSEDIENVRNHKEVAIEQLVGIFDNWKNSNSTFEEHISLELREIGAGYFKVYFEYLRRMCSADPIAHLYAPVKSHYIQSLLHIIKDAYDDESKLKIIRNFFTSEHFANVPSNWIAARMFAILREGVKNGAYANRGRATKRLSGFFYDVDHISLYAPYCDAIVMDNAMAELVSDKRLSLSENFSVKVFCLNNWNELHEWLDNLESSMSEEHRNAVELAYCS